MAAVKSFLILVLLNLCAGGHQDSWQWHGLKKAQLEVVAEEHKEQIQCLQAIENEGLLEKNPLNIKCDEIDWTFYYQSPFLHMYLPKCGNVIQPKMVLLRPGKECQLDSYNLPNNATDDCVEELIWADEVEEVVIMVHGFLKSLSNSKWMHKLADRLMSTDIVSPQNKTRAVLLVGWGHGSGALPFRDPLYYYQAAANTRYMGVSVARVLSSFMDKLSILTNHANHPLGFHCIGHSLGAHICGFSGQTLKTISHIVLNRISGLDPAGPMFAVDVPYPFNWLNIAPEARLNKDDAEFVDVIHTDGRARFHWSIVPQYGTMTQMGHVDFFPGADQDFGWDQPGCWQVQDVSSCSHSRSHDLYLFSVSDPCTAIQTCTNSTIIPATCINITTNAPVMGYWVDKSIRGKVYTVQTGAVEPFCNTCAILPEKENLEILQIKNYKTETRKNEQLWKVKQKQIIIYKTKVHQKKKNIRYK